MAALTAAASLLVLLVPAAPAGAGTVGPWGVAPATTSTNQRARPFFDYSQPAGGTIRDSVSISNFGDYPLTYDLYPADGYNLANGAFGLRGASDPRVDVGAWIRLSTRVVSVPPHKMSIVPFTIGVPLDATPGDHAGGIVALLRPVAAPAPGGNQVQTREGVGARIYLRVPGPLRPMLAVTSVSIATRTGAFGGGNARIRASLANTGNVRLDATAQVKVTDVFGDTVKVFPAMPLNALLPGSRITLTENWRNLPFAGPYQVKVMLSSAGVKGTGATSTWVIPWAVVVLVGLLLCGLVAWRVWRRRARARANRGGSPPPPQTIEPRKPAGVTK